MKKNRFKKLICILSIVIGAAQLFSSCNTAKKVVYFQDMVPGVTEIVQTPTEDLTIRTKDKLSIIVNSQDEKLSQLFNLSYGGQYMNSSTHKNELGYTVDTDGNIYFPVIGRIHVDGMTREGVAEYIMKELKQRELIKNPVVIVEYLNLNVNVLGEVTRPGRINIDRDNPTILDAISQAGDLTLQGRRDNIMVLREENGVHHVYSVDITNGRQLYNSPVYHMKQNDIIYVEPNKSKTSTSTTNGGTLRSASFWVSLTSLLTSMVAIIVNL